MSSSGWHWEGDGLEHRYEHMAGQIIDQSLKLCGGDKDVLAQVVQTKFFAGHTPFYWLLVNRHSKPKTPPLLEKLFQLCNCVSAETLEDMTKGLPHRLDDDIYKTVKRYVTPFCPPSTPSFFRGANEQPTAKATPNNSNCDGQLEFSIPLFFDRVLVDGEVSFKFVAMGSLWLLRAVVEEALNADNSEWSWHFELSETHSAIGYKTTFSFRRRACIKLMRSDEGQNPPVLCSSSEVIDRVPTTMRIPIPDVNLGTFRCNPFTSGKARGLSGTLNISDTGIR